MNILKACYRILDLEKTASPAPWFLDYGNGEIECHNKKFWRLPVVQRTDLMDRVRHCEDFEIIAQPVYPDFECEYIVETRNHIRAICASLIQAREALKFYSGFEVQHHWEGKMFDPKLGGDRVIHEETAKVTIAQDWLEKWDQE